MIVISANRIMRFPASTEPKGDGGQGKGDLGGAGLSNKQSRSSDVCSAMRLSHVLLVRLAFLGLLGCARVPRFGTDRRRRASESERAPWPQIR